jgi:hypothetical protein
VSSEENLATPSTEDSNIEISGKKHKEHILHGNNKNQSLIVIPANEAQHDMVVQKKTTEGMDLTFFLMTHASADQLEEWYNLGLRIEVLRT